MIVQRVTTETGSHIEPPLDQDASDLDKLRWLAAVVEHDGCFPEGTFRFSMVPGDQFGLSWSHGTGVTSHSGMPFHLVWRHLTAMLDGVVLARQIR